MPHAHTPGQVVKSSCIKECECKAGSDCDGYCEVELCPLHAAAPEMLEALQEAYSRLASLDDIVVQKVLRPHMHNAITRATGRERG